MAVTFALASRGVPRHQAAILLIAIGTLMGAAMLALFSSYFMLIGAMFGGITAASFVGALWLLQAYPASSR
jgi:hypothetical protein